MYIEYFDEQLKKNLKFKDKQKMGDIFITFLLKMQFGSEI